MATSNKQMSDMLRRRRRELEDGPEEEPSVEIEVKPESPEDSSPTPSFTVAAPGEPSEGEGFEYEPMIDIPGAWVVYPPGVPCDDTEYRIQMTKPAAAGDFAAMQEAIDKAEGGPSKGPTPTTPADTTEDDGY